MTSILVSRQNTLKPLRKDTKFPSASLSVCLSNLKNATTEVPRTLGVYKQMFKAGLRFLLSAFHHRLLQYLGLAITQISPNAWRVFLGVEVLYGVLSNGERRMTAEEFFHYYRPLEITQSKGIYSFLPRNRCLG